MTRDGRGHDGASPLACPCNERPVEKGRPCSPRSTRNQGRCSRCPTGPATFTQTAGVDLGPTPTSPHCPDCPPRAAAPSCHAPTQSPPVYGVSDCKGLEQINVDKDRGRNKPARKALSSTKASILGGCERGLKTATLLAGMFRPRSSTDLLIRGPSAGAKHKGTCQAMASRCP